MDLALAMTVVQKAGAILVFTGIVAPLIGLGLKRLTPGWEGYGSGPFSILVDRPAPRGPKGPPPPLDPAIQAAEVRELLAAKSERRQERGEAPLDVDAEADRLLDAGPAPSRRAAMDDELRSEVRELVVARNERRARQGLEPLDVAAETERQLAELAGG